MRLRGFAIVTPVLLLVPGIAQALTGYEIAKKSEDLNHTGFVGQRQMAIWTLYGPDGEIAVRYKLASLVREGGTNKDKMLMRFLAPPDTKGTALLVHEQKSGDDDRWLYLSEARIVRQIAGTNKSSAFKGSEFAYEDLTPSRLEKYDYELIGERTVRKRPCYDVELTPRFDDSGYSKIRSCFDKERFYVVESQFLDRGGRPLKVGMFGKYKKVQGYWRAHHIEMKNLQTKRRTVVVTGKFKVKLDLSDGLFTVSQLKKQ